MTASRDERRGLTKLYDRYPRLAAYVRGLEGGEQVAVRTWHAFMLDGLRQFRQAYPTEGKLLGNDSKENAAGVTALLAFIKVLEQVDEVLADLRPADWCCPGGMMAHPEPCPQHARPPELGDVQWVDGKRLVWLVDGWHYLGRRAGGELNW